MKRLAIILLGLLAATVAVFLSVSLEIFIPPRVSEQNSLAVQYQPTAAPLPALQCWQAQPDAAASTLPNRLSLVVWNIHKGEDDGWQQALRTYARSAELVLLQEVANTQHIPTLLPDFRQSLFVRAFAFRGRESGVNLLAKAVAQHYCAASEPEPWIRVPKVGQSAIYPLANGQMLLVVNLHLVNFEWNPTNYRRQLSQMVALIARHQGPIIVAGDFNTWNSGRLALLDDLARQFELQKVAFDPDVRLTAFGNPLDHILVRGLRVVQAGMEATDASDHNPLRVTLQADAQ